MTESPKPKSGWRIIRRLLIALAILVTLIAAFYTEENWRGKRDWEKCKGQLEAQGVVLDWDKFLPPPVPNDQNFYTASSNILLRFRRLSENDTNGIEAAYKSKWLRLDPMTNGVPLFPTFYTSKSGPIIVAKIIVSSEVKAHIPQGTNTVSVTRDDPATLEKAHNLISANVGKTIDGVQGFEFSQFQFDRLQPSQIFVRANTQPSIADLESLVPTNTIAKSGRLRVAATQDKNVFNVLLTDVNVTAAADYLKWSDQFVPAFDEIREALKRPYAIIPGDYSVPYAMPIPNFVIMRSLAQTLGQRAQCYLLLGEPDKALHEMTLIHDVSRILEKPPTGKPETLVEAMINIAIHGLYVQVMAEGMQRHAWQEPQLAALQKQLEQIDLPSIVAQSFRSESAATTHTLETISSAKLQEWFSLHPRNSYWVLWKSHLLPRGWIYQNMATSARMVYNQTEGFDSSNGLIEPKKFADVAHELGGIGPYSFITAAAVPNFTKAWQVTAHNQTQVNEAQIACALERYRLAHGEYPETLDALSPQFIETFPHDIIGGKPLIYRRADDGKFLLYSIGWNETDDGGIASRDKFGTVTNYATGDWVWPN